MWESQASCWPLPHIDLPASAPEWWDFRHMPTLACFLSLPLVLVLFLKCSDSLDWPATHIAKDGLQLLL